jgi:hypothetical protein
MFDRQATSSVVGWVRVSIRGWSGFKSWWTCLSRLVWYEVVWYLLMSNLRQGGDSYTNQ